MLKPYIATACICENVLQEKDNVFSAIRIVDTLHAAIPDKATAAGMVGVIEVRALVTVKSAGHPAGEYKMRMVLNYPSNKQKELPEFTVPFKEGSLSGHSTSLRLAVEIKEFGDYFLDVLWEGEILTRIPFRVIRAEPPARPTPS